LANDENSSIVDRTLNIRHISTIMNLQVNICTAVQPSRPQAKVQLYIHTAKAINEMLSLLCKDKRTKCYCIVA